MEKAYQEIERVIKAWCEEKLSNYMAIKTIAEIIEDNNGSMAKEN